MLKNSIKTISGFLFFIGIIAAWIYFNSKPLPPYYHEIKALQEEMPEWRILQASQDSLMIARPLHLVDGFGENAFLMNIEKYFENETAFQLSVVSADCNSSEFEIFAAVSHEEAQQKNLVRYYDGYGNSKMTSDFVDTNFLGEVRYFYYTDSNLYSEFSREMYGFFCTDWSREKEIINREFEDMMKKNSSPNL